MPLLLRRSLPLRQRPGYLAACSLLALLSLPASAAPPPPTAAPPHAFAIEDLARLARVSDPQLSPDGRELYFAISWARLAENRWQSALYVQELPQSGLDGQKSAAPRRLTFPERGPKQEGQDSSPRLSPDGRFLAFLSTRDGASPELYVLRTSGGEARRLTNLPNGVQALYFTSDSRALVIQAHVYPDCPPYPAGAECNKHQKEAREKHPIKARLIDRLFYRWWDHWNEGLRSHLLRVLVPSGDEPATLVDLTPGDVDAPAMARSGANPVALSPDGQELAYVQNRDKEVELSTNNDVMVLPLSADYTPAGEPRNLTEGNQATDVAPRYSPDGRYLAYLAQRRPGFESDRFEIWIRDRKSGEQHSLTASFDATVHSLEWAPDSQRLYFVAGVKGRDVLYSLSPSDKLPPVELSSGDCGDLQVRRSGDGATLVFLRSSLQHPAEVYRIDVTAQGRARGPAQPLTRINEGVLAGIKLTATSELWAQSKDGLPLHSFLIKPPDFSPGRRYPAVVLVHGGPQGAWEDVWQWRWNAQLFAGAGYVVLMPNPRGSEGFGQRFVDQVSGDWGGRPYDDVMRLVDKLVAEPYVDPKHVAAAGASFGGYMVDWIAGHTDRFAALVSHAGVYDLRSMYGETEELWFPRWEFQGDPWSSAQYDRFSPSRFADHFKTPMLVVSNEHDFRVPLGQGMQLFTALQVRKVPSRLLIFPEENHWVLRPANARLWYSVVLDWLHRYLGGTAIDAKALEAAGTYIH
jgi:dipeptidyl aminopeptidase/acylaminoacyl peptidase